LDTIFFIIYFILIIFDGHLYIFLFFIFLHLKLISYILLFLLNKNYLQIPNFKIISRHNYIDSTKLIFNLNNKF
jgi:hypothetical protein